MSDVIFSKLICLLVFIISFFVMLSRSKSASESAKVERSFKVPPIPEARKPARTGKWNANETILAAYLAIYGDYKEDRLTNTLSRAIGRKSSSMHSKAMKLRAGYKGQRKLSNKELAIFNMIRESSKWRAEQQVVEAMTKLTNYDGNWLYDEGYFNKLI